MLEKSEFENWIKASHALFEIFEGRYDAYPLAKKWVQQWFSFEEFIVEKQDITVINGFIEDFDYNVFRNFRDPFERDDANWERLKNRINNQFKGLVKKNFDLGKRGNVGLAIAPFLFTWNFQRFKEYFKRETIDLEYYFKELGRFTENKRGNLEVFKDKKLI